MYVHNKITLGVKAKTHSAVTQIHLIPLTPAHANVTGNLGVTTMLVLSEVSSVPDQTDVRLQTPTV